MVMVTYQEISLKKTITGTCLKCGRENRKVTIVSSQTVNPWNKNPDGSIKTYEEVYKSVLTNLPLLVKRWEEKFICKSCEREHFPPGAGKHWFEKTSSEYIRDNLNK